MKIDTVKDWVKDSVRVFTKKIYRLPIGLEIFLNMLCHSGKASEINYEILLLLNWTTCVFPTTLNACEKLEQVMWIQILQSLTFIIEWSNHIPWYFQKEVEGLYSQKHLPTDSLKIYSYLLLYACIWNVRNGIMCLNACAPVGGAGGCGNSS